MTNRISIIVFTCAVFACQFGCSLGLRQDYVLDRTMTYSPDDPFVRGSVYKAHIGHDGPYYNCDQEEQKRYAPWIQWRQRPCDSQSCWREVKELRKSYDDAICRWKMGSCQICPSPNFPPGAGYGVEAQNQIQTLPTGSMSVLSESGTHRQISHSAPIDGSGRLQDHRNHKRAAYSTLEDRNTDQRTSNTGRLPHSNLNTNFSVIPAGPVPVDRF